MDKKWLLSLLLALPLVANAECYCDDEPEDDGEFRAYSYAGIKGGKHELNDAIVPAASNKGNGTGVYIGTRFTEYFAVEMDYTRLGNVMTVSNGSARTQALSLSGVHQVNIGLFDLYGKLGATYTHTSFPAAVPSTKNIGLNYGFGLNIHLNKDIDVRIGWENYKVKITGESNDTLTFMGISIPLLF